MKPLRRVLRDLSLFAVLVSSGYAQMSVKKVEPANWWIGLPHDPMLLVYGEGLAKAKVTTSYPGVTISRVETQPNGRHLFIWMKVAKTAKRGRVKIRVQASPTATEFS